jgi:hypothetical protein
MADRLVLPRWLTEAEATRLRDRILAHDFGAAEPATFAASPAPAPSPDLDEMLDLLRKLKPPAPFLVRLTLNPDDLDRWKGLVPLVLDAPDSSVLGTARIDLQTNAHVPPGRGVAHYSDGSIEVVALGADGSEADRSGRDGSESDPHDGSPEDPSKEGRVEIKEKEDGTVVVYKGASVGMTTGLAEAARTYVAQQQERERQEKKRARVSGMLALAAMATSELGIEESFEPRDERMRWYGSPPRPPVPRSVMMGVLPTERELERARTKGVTHRFRVTLREDGRVLKTNWFRSDRVALAFAKRLSRKRTSSFDSLSSRFVHVDNVVTGDSRVFSRALDAKAQASELRGDFTIKIGNRVLTPAAGALVRVGPEAEDA